MESADYEAFSGFGQMPAGTNATFTPDSKIGGTLNTQSTKKVNQTETLIFGPPTSKQEKTTKIIAPAQIAMTTAPKDQTVATSNQALALWMSSAGPKSPTNNIRRVTIAVDKLSEAELVLLVRSAKRYSLRDGRFELEYQKALTASETAMASINMTEASIQASAPRKNFIEGFSQLKAIFATQDWKDLPKEAKNWGTIMRTTRVTNLMKLVHERNAPFVYPLDAKSLFLNSYYMSETFDNLFKETYARIRLTCVTLMKLSPFFEIIRDSGSVTGNFKKPSGEMKDWSNLGINGVPPLATLVNMDRDAFWPILKVGILPDPRKLLQAYDYRMSKNKPTGIEFCTKAKNKVANMMIMYIHTWALINGIEVPDFTAFDLNAKSTFSQSFYRCRTWLHLLLRTMKYAVFGRKGGEDTRSKDQADFEFAVDSEMVKQLNLAEPDRTVNDYAPAKTSAQVIQELAVTPQQPQEN